MHSNSGSVDLNRKAGSGRLKFVWLWLRRRRVGPSGPNETPDGAASRAQTGHPPSGGRAQPRGARSAIASTGLGGIAAVCQVRSEVELIRSPNVTLTFFMEEKTKFIRYSPTIQVSSLGPTNLDSCLTAGKTVTAPRNLPLWSQRGLRSPRIPVWQHVSLR